jgi:hypothetical protein
MTGNWIMTFMTPFIFLLGAAMFGGGAWMLQGTLEPARPR